VQLKLDQDSSGEVLFYSCIVLTVQKHLLRATVRDRVMGNEDQ